MKRICCNAKCGWVGDADDCVCFTHDPDYLMCPECYEATEELKELEMINESNWIEEVRVFLYNLKSAHHRIMMRYLRRRGWVVFYLDEPARKCNNECWLHLYEQETK